jgi:predicted SnoaL-like aldol condensation-catalyzing enzyme
VNIVRAFEDGDFVFAHTEYDFASSNIGFEIFRFEGDQAVEHWDNIQPRLGPNASGHTMVDGPTEAVDLELSDVNQELVRSFVYNILIGRQLDKLDHYIDNQSFTEHNPHLADGVATLRTALEETGTDGRFRIEYQKLHRVLAQGCFVLSVSEGFVDSIHSSFFDLFRVVGGKLVEHWDTTEAIPPRSEWKNDNGKF